MKHYLRGGKLALAAATAGTVAALAFLPALAQPPQPQPAVHGPWMDKSLSPDKRADLVLAEMTLDEKILLVHGLGGFGAAGGRSNGGAGVISGIRQARTSGPAVGRFGGRRAERRGPRALRHAAAIDHRRGRHLGSEAGL